MFTKKKEKIHFIGIGGIGMSAIALVLNSIDEFTITGSDLAKTPKTQSLEDCGIKVYYGHKESNVEDDVTAVVSSSAISPTNEEIISAKKKNIIVIPRGEMLAEIMRLKQGIAISGSHGKTTTTSLISQIMIEAKLNPICIIGGNHFNLKSNAYCNLNSEYMVCEADESDGSFLRLSPVFSVVTNIDNDHLDYYGNVEKLRLAFLDFINKVPFYGCSFLCFENDVVRDLAKSVTKKYYSYGFSNEYDFYVDKDSIKMEMLKTYFKAYYKDKFLGEFELPLIGKHNILNSLASIAVAYNLNIDTDTIKKALKTFEGVGRRLNKLYDKEITLFDDYAHHPTEIKATLSSLRNAYKDRRIIAIFQPHRYSRTQLLLNDFENAFLDADNLIITDIYAAGESPIAGISGETICKIVKNNNIKYIKNIEDILPELEKIKKDGDIIITLGAGNIVKVSNDYAKKLSGS